MTPSWVIRSVLPIRFNRARVSERSDSHMTSRRVLLIESNPARAKSIAAALSSGSECFETPGVDKALEALAVQQFDLVLVTSEDGSSIARELQPVVRALRPQTSLMVWGECEPGVCDAVIPSATPEAELGREIDRSREALLIAQDEFAAHLTLFDSHAFEEQMAGDPELMREIINIFLEESAGQLQELRRALSAHEYSRLSGVAHSLKGSLGSLHAARARHWAQELERAAADGDGDRSAHCLTALEQTVSALTPKLQELLTR